MVLVVMAALIPADDGSEKPIEAKLLPFIIAEDELPSAEAMISTNC